MTPEQTSINQITFACDALKEALIAEYEASQMEENSKLAKIRSHNNVLLAFDQLRDIKLK